MEGLIVYEGTKRKGLEVEKFISKAKENLAPLKDALAKEKEAKVRLKDDTLSVEGFKDDVLGKRIFQALYDTLYPQERL